MKYTFTREQVKRIILEELENSKVDDAAEEIVTRLLADPNASQVVIHRWSDPDRDRKTNAKEVLRLFASRAFRRPVQQDELARLMELVELRTAAESEAEVE